MKMGKILAYKKYLEKILSKQDTVKLRPGIFITLDQKEGVVYAGEILDYPHISTFHIIYHSHNGDSDLRRGYECDIIVKQDGMYAQGIANGKLIEMRYGEATTE